MESGEAPAEFSVASEGSTTVVLARGELDLAVKDTLSRVLQPLQGRVIVDLSDVTFMDSSAIGVLVGAARRLATSGGVLRLRAPHETPRTALEVTGLGDWIDD
jgi:anti-sigma B factor antagonist